MRTVCCLICETTYDEGDQCAIEGKHSGALYGVCPECNAAVKIGRRVKELQPKLISGVADPLRSWHDGWNSCLREAKGEKP